MDNIGLSSFIDELGLTKGLESPTESLSLSSYLKLVDWTEPWLVGLIISHVIIFATVIALRSRFTIQSTLGLFMLGTVYMSETINEYAAKNWKLFARHQYFDEKGFFISTVLSAPLLFNCLIVVMNFLLQNYYTLKDIRQMKLRQARQSRESGTRQQSSEEDNSEKSSITLKKDKND